MAGLLDGVLPWVYSRGNALQRGVNGLLSDPLGSMEQTAGLLADYRREDDRLNALVFGDPKTVSKPERDQALNQLANRMLSGPLGFAPVGMTAPKPLTRLPSSASLSTPDAPSAELMRELGRVERVPLSMARGTQPKMDWERFRKGDSPGPVVKGYADKPVAVRREDGEYLIFDGHHRTVDAMNNGRDAIDMYVVDARAYAPEAAGRKPVAQKVDTDDLLRELFGR